MTNYGIVDRPSATSVRDLPIMAIYCQRSPLSKQGPGRQTPTPCVKRLDYHQTILHQSEREVRGSRSGLPPTPYALLGSHGSGLESCD
jgi:hypothetical protein